MAKNFIAIKKPGRAELGAKPGKPAKKLNMAAAKPGMIGKQVAKTLNGMKK